MDGQDDVSTAKNEAELIFNDPNATLPTQYSPSVPVVALSSPPSPSGRRESAFPPTVSEMQLAAIHAAHSAERDVLRSDIHAVAADLAGEHESPPTRASDANNGGVRVAVGLLKS